MESPRPFTDSASVGLAGLVLVGLAAASFTTNLTRQLNLPRAIDTAKVVVMPRNETAPPPLIIQPPRTQQLAAAPSPKIPRPAPRYPAAAPVAEAQPVPAAAAADEAQDVHALAPPEPPPQGGETTPGADPPPEPPAY